MNPSTPSGGEPPPPQPPSAKVEPSPEKLQSMNDSAEKSASPVKDGSLTCPPKKKSWFAIRVINQKDSTCVEGMTLKLNIPDLGDTDRLTSKASDPTKIDQLEPGGKGNVKQIECGDHAWEAVGDIT
jgi:hypothetical protein